MKYIMIFITLIVAYPLFSYCQSNKDDSCLKFKQSIKLGTTKSKLEVKDIIVDKFSNKYILLNKKDSLLVRKLDKNNVLIWETKINALGVNILKNGESEIYITTYYNQDLNLEINNKKIKIKSNNTNASLILKLNNETGKIINYLNISTNYGVVTYISKFKDNKLYIAGYYGGKSKLLDKKAYEDAFLLVLDENLKKICSKVIIKNGFLAIYDIKIGKYNIYLKTSDRKFYRLNRKNKKIEEILKGANIKLFDIDENENMYALTYNNYIKKFNNTLKLVSTNNLKDFDYALTPFEVKLKKDSLFIEYIARIEHRNNIIISKYDLNLNNIWHYAILGDRAFSGIFKIINKTLYLFGAYYGSLNLSDEIKFYNFNTSNYLFEFEEK